MSDAQASVNLEEEHPAASNLEEEGSSERVAKKSKGKKKSKGAAKKRRESLEKEKDDDGEGEGSSSLKKKKGKKKAALKVSETSEIRPEVESVAGEASILDETPKETVVEIKDEKHADDLQEIVVKKEGALVEGGDNVVQETAVAVESGEEEKNDEKKDSEGEGSKETMSESNGAGVRRRATLSDIRSESVDKRDGEQPPVTAIGSEVNITQ